MEILAVLVLSFVAVCSAIPEQELPPYDPPPTHDEFDLKPGNYRFGLKALLDGEGNSWYLRFSVKSSDKLFIQFSPQDEDGSDKSYEVVIGDKKVTLQKGSASDPDVREFDNKIINGKWQQFYIRQNEGYWEIGDEENGRVIASFNDENVFAVKYVGVKSEKRSWWKIERIGIGRRLIRQDIHKPGSFVWVFPEILKESFYFEFGVKAERDAKLVFSPTNGYGEDIYEIIILAEGKYLCLRRKKDENPIVDVRAANILHKNQFRYFWVRYDYDEGRLTFARYGEEEPLIDFTDDNPLRIRYFGITSEKVKSWWRFFTPGPEPRHICQDGSYELKCSEGEIITIKNALYGRDNKGFCYRKGAVKKTSGCGDPDRSHESVRRECAGKQECTIKANNDVFDNPCYGTVKYLQLEYSCCRCDD